MVASNLFIVSKFLPKRISICRKGFKKELQSSAYIAPILFLFVLSIFLASCSVHYYRAKTSSHGLYYQESLPYCSVRSADNVTLAVPIAGLFVGVSNYSEKSQVFSTPAHSISAAMFRAPFSVAARKSDFPARLASLADVPEYSYMLPEDPHNLYDSDVIFDRRSIDNAVHGEPIDVVSSVLRRTTPGFSLVGNIVTKKDIQKAISQAVSDAQQILYDKGEVLLLFYFSAHGWLGAEGSPFLLPGDADADDPNTWLAYQDIINSIEILFKNNPNYSANVRAIIIFDTCQILAAKNFSVMDSEIHIPLGVTIMQSTSPGQYAWHWTAETKMEYHKEVISETRWGFPPPPKMKRGVIQRRIATNMSVMPLANKCIILKYSESLEGMKPSEKDFSIDNIISQKKCLSDIKEHAETFLSKIPELKEAKFQQDITVLNSDEKPEFPLFILIEEKNL